MSEDEPSIPMDQEEEDNDEYFSARESVGKKNSEENIKLATPVKSDRDSSSKKCDSTPSSKGSSSGKSDRHKMFFSDEKAQQGSENSNKKSEKVKRMLKDRSRWDMIEYEKEDLEVRPKNKKKKKDKIKTKLRMETEEKSKTDEESEEKENKEPPPSSDEPSHRAYFQSEQLILRTKIERPNAPKCKFDSLRFAKGQEIVEYDSEGMQHQLGHYNERAISNPWRRWGAHRALCDQGGYLVDKNKKIVEIQRGSDPPPCPPNPRQVTLNKNCEVPDSQTMMGTLRVEVGQAEDEVYRIGRVMEEYAKNGGFVPPQIAKKEISRPNQQLKQVQKAQPIVVIQTKGGNQPKDGSAVKVKPKKKPSKPNKKKKSGSESDSVTEDESIVEKTKKKQEIKDQRQEIRDDSRGGPFGFFKRKRPQQTPTKGKKVNNKGSMK